MRITTLNGKDRIIPDTCSYCQLDTASNHEPRCPCYVNSYIARKINGQLFVEIVYHPTIQQDVNVY